MFDSKVLLRWQWSITQNNIYLVSNTVVPNINFTFVLCFVGS